MKYLYGPVASRRLGVSLGVDLVTAKTCSHDCVYCEAGETTNLTMERREYVPVNEVLAELGAYLARKPELDYITFSGAGEPTLNNRIGEVVRFIRTNYPNYKICLLTNGSLLGTPGILAELNGIDLIVPSLDSSDEAEFLKINRPPEELHFADFIGGLRSFFAARREGAIQCRCFLELFVVPGVNDSDDSIRRFAALIAEFRPDLVQLNSLDRPGIVDWLRPATRAELERFITVLEGIVPVECVGRFRYRSASLCRVKPLTQVDQEILDLLSRRPGTVDDLALALNLEPSQLIPRLHALLEGGVLALERLERGEFYSLARARKSSQ
ncbi:MAG: radical SAM protein [Victivallaceae bacterium]|nr:radical SAM protein [Victivallaceae bacterium]